MQKAIWRVAALSLGLLGGGQALAGSPAREQPAPTRTSAYKVEEVSVVSAAGGVTLHGTLLLPVGTGPFPAVVLLPDLGAEDPAYDGLLLRSLADSLAQQGVMALRLDERGTGKSGGKATEVRLADRLADVAAALAKLRTQPQADLTRIGLVGHGRGGNVALLAAAQPLPPSFIVAIAASGVSGEALLAAQVPMYGKLLDANYDKLERQRQQTLGQLQMKQVAFQMQAQGTSSAQVQAYTTQQTTKLLEADRKWEAALQKHQRLLLETVVYTPADDQAQAMLTNMMRQQYPNASLEEAQRTARRMTTVAYRDYLTLNPLATLANVKCPVLLVQGMADTQVNPTLNLDALLKGLSGNPKVAERRLKDLDHHLRFAADVPAKQLTPAAPIAYHEVSRWIQQVH